jgi:hypothetical protein
MAELSGQGPVLHSGATSVVDDTQIGKLGRRAYDVDGNEYVYVDFQEACIRGEWVVFTSAYAASQLTSTSRGFVGVVDGTVSASDRFGWVMVRGIHTAAWCTSGSSSGFPVIAAATTDLGTVDTLGTSVDASFAISGVLVASAPDTCASTALSTSALAAPATVILNYPFITGVVSVATSA